MTRWFVPQFRLHPKYAKELNKTHHINFDAIPTDKIAIVNFDIELAWRLYRGLDATIIHMSINKTREDYIMAFKNDWKNVNIRLSEKDKKPLAEFEEHLDMGLEGLIQEVAGLGYKLSLVWVDKQNSWCASIIGKKDSPRNANSSLSSWSDDLEEAIVIGLYKDQVLCKNGNWSDFEREVSNWG